MTDKWEKAQKLQQAGTVADQIAASFGAVEARYHRDSRTVLLCFETSAWNKVVEAVARVIGEINLPSLRKSGMGGDVVVHLPAQVFVDKLGGEVPGFQRQY